MLLNTERALASGLIRHLQRQLEVTEHRCFAIAHRNRLDSGAELVDMICAVPGEKLKLHDGSSTTFSEFQRDPESCLSTIAWDNEEDCIHWTYQV